MFLTIALPFAVMAFILSWLALPHISQKKASAEKLNLTDEFRKIVGNRSALFCLLCVLLSEITWGVTVVYGMSFIRERFGLTPQVASFLFIGTSIFFILGSLVGGRLINLVGRKQLAVLSNILLGVFTLIYLNMGLIWFAIVALFIACVGSTIRFTSSESLVLEQIPELQGSVMSLYTVSLGLGDVIGAALGGYVLMFLGYGGLGLFGLLSIAATILYHFFTNDTAITKER